MAETIPISGLQFKSGPSTRLPSEALLGQPLFTTDKKQLYIGMGAGQSPARIGCYFANELAASLGLSVFTSDNLTNPTVQDYLNKIDAAINLTVEAILSVPPASPAVGSRYAIDIGATGAWAGKNYYIAQWNGSTWNFLKAYSGWIIFDKTTSKPYYLKTSGWQGLLISNSQQLLFAASDAQQNALTPNYLDYLLRTDQNRTYLRKYGVPSSYTISGGYSWASSGYRYNKSLLFSPTTSFQIPSIPNFTLSIWVRAYNNVNGSIFTHVPSGLTIRILNGRLEIHTEKPWEFDIDCGPASESWNHIVVENTGGDGWSFWLNGVQKTMSRVSHLYQGSTPTTFQFGTHGSTALGVRESFTGTVGETRIYSRYLSQAEITELYNGTIKDDASLVYHFRFDEGSGNIVSSRIDSWQEILTTPSNLGVANGIATLDANGKVPSGQLNSYATLVDGKVPISQLPAGTANGLATLDADGKILTSQLPILDSSGTIQDLGNISENVTLSFTNGNTIKMTLTGNPILFFPDGGTLYERVELLISQDGSGNRTISFSPNVKLPSGITPVLTYLPNSMDLIELSWLGSYWIVANFSKDLR